METRLKSKKSALHKGSHNKVDTNSVDTIESCGEGSQASTTLKESQNSIAMAESADTLREMGQLFADTMSRLTRQMEDASLDRFQQMLESQGNSDRDAIDKLGGHLEQMRISKEKERGRVIHTLVKYDGANIDIDEWQESTEGVIAGNQWDMIRFLEMLPNSLSGQAKRAYKSLADDDKLTKDSFFKAMRKKIDPLAKSRNKDLFTVARRENDETVTGYIDRLRMYVKRSGGDPNGHWAMEMMKSKAFDCLSTTDSKILRASVGRNEELDKITEKADAMLGANVSVLGAVLEGEEQLLYPKYMNGNYRDESGESRFISQGDFQQPFRGRCWDCNQPGHKGRFCPINIYQEQYHEAPLDMGDVQSNLEPSTPTQPFLDLGDPRKEGPPPNDFRGQIGSANKPAKDQTDGGKSSLLVSDKATCLEPKGNGVLDNIVQSSGRRLSINL